MNYFKTIKTNMKEVRNRMGMGDKCLVDSKALRMLLDDYERMNSHMKAHSEYDYATLEHNLRNHLHALYLYTRNHDSEELMLMIMDMLKPLIEERLFERNFDAAHNS